MTMLKQATAVLLASLSAMAIQAGEGKLLATPGVMQVEGSGGGGLVPWATLAGYGARDETAVTAFASMVDVDDYRMDVWGAAFTAYDRVELSAARQNFQIDANGAEIRQDVFGLKVRLVGDMVYGEGQYTYLPQLSAGVQYKHLLDPEIPTAVGADNANHGTDVYLAATRLHLGALVGYNVLWNLTARGTKANQLGLLGFGGDRDNSYSFVLEGSAAVLFSRSFALGVEYRQKPDNLSAIKEQDWKDVFIAWIPNKHVNLTAAWVDLGDVAGAPDQSGLYVSLVGYLQ